MFTIQGLVQFPWQQVPWQAEITWRAVDDRADREGPWRGSILAVERLLWMEEEEVEMALTPTGPTVQANSDDPLWSWLAATDLISDWRLMAGQTPTMPVFALRKGDVA